MTEKTTPKHYHGTKIIEFIEELGLGFSLGNVIKYVARAGKKAGESALDDLRKARFYLNHIIEHVEKMERDELKEEPAKPVILEKKPVESANKETSFPQNLSATDWWKSISEKRMCECGKDIFMPLINGSHRWECSCGVGYDTSYYSFRGERSFPSLTHHYEDSGVIVSWKCHCGKRNLLSSPIIEEEKCSACKRVYKVPLKVTSSERPNNEE